MSPDLPDLTPAQATTLQFMEVLGIEVLDTAPPGTPLQRLEVLDAQRAAGNLTEDEFQAAVLRLHRTT